LAGVKECTKHGGIRKQIGMTTKQIHQTDHMVVITEKDQQTEINMRQTHRRTYMKVQSYLWRKKLLIGSE